MGEAGKVAIGNPAALTDAEINALRQLFGARLTRFWQAAIATVETKEEQKEQRA